MRLHRSVFISVLVIGVGLAPVAGAQTAVPPAGVAATGTDIEAMLVAEADADLPDWMLSSGSWLANGIPNTDAEPAPAPEPAEPKAKKKKPSPIDIAIKTAQAQIGKPYRWGAVGPNSFDCSGLVNFAFAAAGISLPRTSRGMYAALKPVARSDLKRGDLVFSGWGRVGHVGIYLGDGRMVHSPHTGDRVKVSPLRRNLIRGGRVVG